MATFLDPFQPPTGPNNLNDAEDAIKAIAVVYKRQMGYAQWHILTEEEIDDLLKRIRPIIKKWEG